MTVGWSVHDVSDRLCQFTVSPLSFKQVLIILAGSPEIVSQTRYGRKQKDTMEPNQELEHALFFPSAFVSSFNNTEDSRWCDNQSLKPESQNKEQRSRPHVLLAGLEKRFVITLSIIFICFISTSECETGPTYLLFKESVFVVDLMELVGSYLRETESHPSPTTGLVCSLKLIVKLSSQRKLLPNTTISILYYRGAALAQLVNSNLKYEGLVSWNNPAHSGTKRTSVASERSASCILCVCLVFAASWHVLLHTYGHSRI